MPVELRIAGNSGRAKKAAQLTIEAGSVVGVDAVVTRSTAVVGTGIGIPARKDE